MSNKITTTLEGLGFSVTNDPKTVTIEGGMISVCRYVTESDRLEKASPFNGASAMEKLNSSNSGFIGGTIAALRNDLAGEKDLKAFFKERDKLEKSGLVEKIQEQSNNLRESRRRKFSDQLNDRYC